MNLTSVVISSHWRSITVLLAKSGWVLKTILFDYALIPAPRDTICGLNAHMTARNDIRNIHLQCMSKKDHNSSLEVTRGKKLETSHRDPIFCMYTQISLRNCIMHESLFLEVIEGYIRSQKVKNWFKLNAWKFAPQSYLSYNSYKVNIMCVQNYIDD